MNLFKQNNQTQLAACIGVIAIIVSTGCHYFYDQVGEEKRIPSPISDELPFELNGKIYRVWRGNELQFKSNVHTTYLLLQGVDNPDRDEATEQAAIDFVHSLIESEQIRAVVVAFDERKRAIAQVYSGETNINFEIIKNGWGRFDGTPFDQSDRYRAAEKDARAAKLGMWGL